MSRYQQLQQKAIGVALILAPLFITIGAAIYLLGIERSRDNTSSWVEGVFMAYGMLIMIPVHLELARRLGERAPIFGILCAFTGLGIGFALHPTLARLLQEDLVLAGIDASVWSITPKFGGWLPIQLWGALGLLTPIFLGIGFLLKGGIARPSAILLILTPFLFVIGQGGDQDIAWWQVNIFYPLACVTWLAALAPLGWRMLTGNAQPADARSTVALST